LQGRRATCDVCKASGGRRAIVRDRPIRQRREAYRLQPASDAVPVTPRESTFPGVPSGLVSSPVDALGNGERFFGKLIVASVRSSDLRNEARLELETTRLPWRELRPWRSVLQNERRNRLPCHMVAAAVLFKRRCEMLALGSEEPVSEPNTLGAFLERHGGSFLQRGERQIPHPTRLSPVL
jgi:hypothetical protein